MTLGKSHNLSVTEFVFLLTDVLHSLVIFEKEVKGLFSTPLYIKKFLKYQYYQKKSTQN